MNPLTIVTLTLPFLFNSLVSCDKYSIDPELYEILKCRFDYYRDSDYDAYEKCKEVQSANSYKIQTTPLPFEYSLPNFSPEDLETFKKFDMTMISVVDNLVGANESSGVDLDGPMKAVQPEIDNPEKKYLEEIFEKYTSKLKLFKCFCDYKVDSDMSKLQTCSAQVVPLEYTDLLQYVTPAIVEELYKNFVDENGIKKKILSGKILYIPSRTLYDYYYYHHDDNDDADEYAEFESDQGFGEEKEETEENWDSW